MTANVWPHVNAHFHTKRMKAAVSVLGLALSLLTACASAPFEVRVEPLVTVEDSNHGAGRSVSLRVVDERPRLQVGTSTGRPSFGQDITVAENLSEIVYQGIAKGLTKYQFTVSPAAPDSYLDLHVRILLLDYRSIDHSPKLMMERRFEAALAATCRQNAQIAFEQVYRGIVSYEVMLNVAITPESTDFRDALSWAVDKLLRDQQLQDCLASPAR